MESFSDIGSKFNYEKLVLLCNNKDRLLAWLRLKHILGNFASECICQKGHIKLRKENALDDGYIWRCTNKKCYKKISIRHNSWFSLSRLSIPTIMKITYFWVYKLQQDFVQHELDLSEHTLVDWYNCARDVCCT
jgi:hypothetical protein